MRKLFLLLIVIASIAKQSQAQNHKTDLQEMNLKGKVKSLKESTYQATDKGGKVQKEKIYVSYDYVFNEQGYKIEKNEYNTNGSLDNKCTYLYNDKGNNIEVNMY